jgi:hypothetical protein
VFSNAAVWPLTTPGKPQLAAMLRSITMPLLSTIVGNS